MGKPRYKQNFVTLREKKMANGKASLYLDIYSEGFRTYEFLKIYVFAKPSTVEHRAHNQQMLQLAEQIKLTKESELKHSEYGVVSPNKKKINFLDYYQHFLDNYTKQDKRMIKSALDHFNTFLEENSIMPTLKFKDITESLLERFRDFLFTKFTGETPHSYFARFKKVIKQAYRDNYFNRNPAEHVRCSVPDNITKAILNLDEIQLLAKTPCGNEEVRRAFLFCLNTGLRFVDVKSLKWEHIDGDLLIKQQSKTQKDAIIYLNSNAKTLMGNRKKANELIFTLPTIESCIKTVKNWGKRAQIDKNLTWHSARHSFAVNLLSNQTDIKTVSSLLGHSGLKHTEKYTHVVDSLKKSAVHTLPDLDL